MIIKVRQLGDGRWHWVLKYDSGKVISQSPTAYADASLANYGAEYHKKALIRLGVTEDVIIQTGKYNIPDRSTSKRKHYPYSQNKTVRRKTSSLMGNKMDQEMGFQIVPK